MHAHGQKCTSCTGIGGEDEKHLECLLPRSPPHPGPVTHTPLDGCRPASHDIASRMRLTDGWLCVLYTLSICISTSSQPLSISSKTRPLQADKVGLGRRDRLSEGRQGCFRAPITYALKNFSLAAIIQELLFAREGMRNRKRVNEESQRVD